MSQETSTSASDNSNWRAWRTQSNNRHYHGPLPEPSTTTDSDQSIPNKNTRHPPKGLPFRFEYGTSRYSSNTSESNGPIIRGRPPGWHRGSNRGSYVPQRDSGVGRGSNGGFRGGYKQNTTGSTAQLGVADNWKWKEFDASYLVDKDILEGLEASPIAIIPIPMDDRGSEDMRATEVRCIGSYNWVESARDKPTIVVPGSPPQWKAHELPYTISTPDQGVRIIDQSGYRISGTGASILLPLICAVNKCANPAESSFDWSSVDVVADRSVLRKLIRWANGKASMAYLNTRSEGNFRIDVEWAGEKTLLMSRVPLRFAERFCGNTYREGFNADFTQAARDSEEFLDHYRVVTYNMNGLRMVVRFEVDAFMPDLNAASEPQSAERLEPIDDIANALAATSITHPATGVFHGLTVTDGGLQISPSSVAEFKTQSYRNKWRFVDWSEIYTQVFLAQTENYILARHDKGRFENIRHLNRMSPEIKNAEGNAQIYLKKLYRVFQSLKDLFLDHGKDKRLSLVCVDGVLDVYQRKNSSSCLPDDVLSSFHKAENKEVVEG